MSNFQIKLVGFFIVALLGLLTPPTYAQNEPLNNPPADQSASCNDEIFGCFEVGLPGNSQLSAGKSVSNFVLETNNKPILTFINVAVNAVIAILVLIGVITIVIAGYVYMTAAGDGSKVKTAKEMILAALVGIFLALVSVVILNVVNTYLGGSAQEPQLGPSQQPSNSSGGDNSSSGGDNANNNNNPNNAAQIASLENQIQQISSQLVPLDSKISSGGTLTAQEQIQYDTLAGQLSAASAQLAIIKPAR